MTALRVRTYSGNRPLPVDYRRLASMMVISMLIIVGMVILTRSRGGASIQSQAGLLNSSITHAQAAYAPVSSRSTTLVTLKIIIDGEKPIQATQELGKMITVDFKDSWSLGLVPSFPDQSDTIAVTLLRLDKAHGGNPAMGREGAEIETLNFRGEGETISPRRTQDLPGFDVQLVGIRNTAR